MVVIPNGAVPVRMVPGLNYPSQPLIYRDVPLTPSESVFHDNGGSSPRNEIPFAWAGNRGF